MVKVIYDSSGMSVSDWNAELVAKTIVQDHLRYKGDDLVGDQEYAVANELVIYWLQLLVIRGEIQTKDIAFEFGGQLVTINERGVFSPRIPGFADHLILVRHVIQDETVAWVNTHHERTGEDYEAVHRPASRAGVAAGDESSGPTVAG